MPWPLAKVTCLLSGRGDCGLSYQSTSPPARGDAMKGNSLLLVHNPTPRPYYPPVLYYVLSNKAHGTSFFYLFSPSPFLNSKQQLQQTLETLLLPDKKSFLLIKITCLLKIFSQVLLLVFVKQFNKIKECILDTDLQWYIW